MAGGAQGVTPINTAVIDSMNSYANSGGQGSGGQGFSVGPTMGTDFEGGLGKNIKGLEDAMKLGGAMEGDISTTLSQLGAGPFSPLRGMDQLGINSTTQTNMELSAHGIGRDIAQLKVGIAAGRGG